MGENVGRKEDESEYEGRLGHEENKILREMKGKRKTITGVLYKTPAGVEAAWEE